MYIKRFHNKGNSGNLVTDLVKTQKKGETDVEKRLKRKLFAITHSCARKNVKMHQWYRNNIALNGAQGVLR